MLTQTDGKNFLISRRTFFNEPATYDHEGGNGRSQTFKRRAKMTKLAAQSKKIASVAFAIATVAAAMTASAGSAEARWGHRGAPVAGLIAGGLALGLVGAAIANSEPVYVEDADSFRYRRVCRLEPQYNDFGEYVGRVRVCRTVY